MSGVGAEVGAPDSVVGFEFGIGIGCGSGIGIDIGFETTAAATAAAAASRRINHNPSEFKPEIKRRCSESGMIVLMQATGVQEIDVIDCRVRDTDKDSV